MLLEKQCPECCAQLRIRRGRRGMFVGCSGYPTCTFSRDLAQDELELADNYQQKDPANAASWRDAFFDERAFWINELKIGKLKRINNADITVDQPASTRRPALTTCRNCPYAVSHNGTEVKNG